MAASSGRWLHTTVLLFLTFLLGIECWNNEDFELFDLVEDVGVNFYELLKLDQSVSSNEIRKAYRRLSLQYHPDKNKDPGAEEMFRKIAAVSEVLKDEEKRKKYNLILQNGLPDWRQPVYYYRRVRKMGLWELAFFLFVLLTFGQYLLAWSIYWEKKYELEEVLISKFRKREKKARRSKQGSGEESLIAEHINQIPKPRYQDLLPIQLVSFFFYLIKSAPMFYQQWREVWLDRPKSAIIDDSDADAEASEKVRRIRKKVKPEIPDYTCIFQPVEAPGTGSNGSEESNDTKSTDNTNSETEKTNQIWTDADILNLTRAMNKYPGGTSLRWEKIATFLNRTVEDVITVAKQLKSSTFVSHVPHSLQGLTGLEKDTQQIGDFVETTKNEYNDDTMTKQKIIKDATKSNSSTEEKLNSEKELDGSWNQRQQKALEVALQQFPKGTEERWEKIAECVKGKTKEECMVRYKCLVELVKKKKYTKS